MSSGLIVVQQYERMIVRRLGTYVGNRRPGLHFLIPLLYSGVKVDLREWRTRVMNQKYITADNIAVGIGWAYCYQVMEGQVEYAVLEGHSLELHNVDATVGNTALFTMRSVIGAMDLATVLSDLERICDDVQIRMNEATALCGVKVSQVEINVVDPPECAVYNARPHDVLDGRIAEAANLRKDEAQR